MIEAIESLARRINKVSEDQESLFTLKGPAKVTALAFSDGDEIGESEVAKIALKGDEEFLFKEVVPVGDDSNKMLFRLEFVDASFDFDLIELTEREFFERIERAKEWIEDILGGSLSVAKKNEISKFRARQKAENERKEVEAQKAEEQLNAGYHEMPDWGAF